MRMKLKMSKETKNTLLAGIAGGLIYDMETVASGLITGYPQILNDRLIPQLPRNGQLVADLGPLAVAYGMDKRHPTARNENIKMGFTLFALPKLMQEIVYNVAYQAGAPAAGLRLRNNIMPIRVNATRLNIRPATNNKVMPIGGGVVGRYAMKTVPVIARQSGIGKYR